MESLIAKIPGVVVYLDDILVTGKDEMEHDLRLREVLKSIQRMGLTLKKEKDSTCGRTTYPVEVQVQVEGDLVVAKDQGHAEFDRTGLYSGENLRILLHKLRPILEYAAPAWINAIYKSELSAIDSALKNINLPSKIIIYSDSRAAIYTLQTCFSSQELLKSITKSVNRLQANSSVTVQWLTAHVENELTDFLAKSGALGHPEVRKSTTQLDERDLLRTIKTQCLQEWKFTAADDWYRAGGTRTNSVLPRDQQSLISRLKSENRNIWYVFCAIWTSFCDMATTEAKSSTNLKDDNKGYKDTLLNNPGGRVGDLFDPEMVAGGAAGLVEEVVKV
ncbi:K02A2.6-like [Cordylochernes scorpioides]|uniref:K02A2.6-like n=1 Tax=Cordylochernes scorpioides TaxID=51811 RepID=A0ABY6K388_9ARAC|nr:K02A2.6-like [Cordylochernes scorpioides]